ncbi:hypothetical protein cym2001_27910 [Pseudomonas sp. CYM-20-01]|uniref:hypothetical protein n=1 Tax=Pseudomonas sp. CYM-20-01 TaxID=2870750 RepID=UPI002048F834|nr:hypothetical protein [Pseudomonas sp. CYM-20-01]BDB19426.1 hypothetical protein cym2001_27910 [Pseudomonas sp. CYM-20-01]
MSTATATENADQPWEDTLILAFRDIQWILHCEKQQALISVALAQFLLDNQSLLCNPSDPTQQNTCNETKGKLYRAVEKMAVTPPLLAKLDGKAESAAGDVLTAHEDRFFLIEFKSDISTRSSEYTKFLGILMWLIDPDANHVLIKRSKKGHFFVTQQPDASAPSNPNLRKLTMEAYTYYDAITQPDLKPTAAIPVHTLLAEKRHGLSLAHMADYLQLLCKAHVGDSAGGAHPMKVAVASASGMFWPITDLSELSALAGLFNTTAGPSRPTHPAFGTANAKHLKGIVDAFRKKTPAQQKAALRRDGRTPGGATPGLKGS